MLTIFDWYNGPYPARVRIAVAELGLRNQVQFESVDLWKGEHKKREFLAKNYSGTLPVLQIEDGTYIAECTAITMYLDNLGTAPALTGITPREKGVIHMMNKRAELEFLDAISVYFHHATPGLGPDVELYQNQEWGLRMRDKALRGAHYFDRVLEMQPFVAGEAFSMADITVIAGFVFAKIAKLEIPTQFTALHAWHGRMLERRSVQGWEKMSAPVEAAVLNGRRPGAGQ
jgi:glutathione S-transferase